MGNTKISVVVTTFNGCKFITHQLDSIRLQTYPIDEVIIADDNSSDGTVMLVKNYIDRYGLKGWILILNEINLGWTKNFHKAIERASGEIIFCADQDDVWEHDKILLMMRTMEENKSVLALECERVIIDSSNEEISHLNKNRNSNGEVRPVSIVKRFNTVKMLGCCCAYRSSIVEMYREIGDYDYGHDIQLCRLAALFGGAYVLGKRLVKYRIHEGNTSGITASVPFGSTTLAKRINDIKDNIVWLKLCIQRCSELEKKQLDVLDCTLKLQIYRLGLISNRRIKVLQCIKMVPMYLKFMGVIFLLADLSYVTKTNKLAGKILWQINNGMYALEKWKIW